jgi:hypothetical protein
LPTFLKMKMDINILIWGTMIVGLFVAFVIFIYSIITNSRKQMANLLLTRNGIKANATILKIEDMGARYAYYGKIGAIFTIQYKNTIGQSFTTKVNGWLPRLNPTFLKIGDTNFPIIIHPQDDTNIIIDEAQLIARPDCTLREN